MFTNNALRLFQPAFRPLMPNLNHSPSFRSNMYSPHVRMRPQFSFLPKLILNQPNTSRFYSQDLDQTKNIRYRKINEDDYLAGLLLGILGLLFLRNYWDKSNQIAAQTEFPFNTHDLELALGVSSKSIETVKKQEDGRITITNSSEPFGMSFTDISKKLHQNDIENSTCGPWIHIEKDGVEDFLRFMKKAKNPNIYVAPTTPRIEGKFPLTLKQLEKVLENNFHSLRKIYEHEGKFVIVLKPSFQDRDMLRNTAIMLENNNIENIYSDGNNFTLTIEKDGIRDFLNYVYKLNGYTTEPQIQTPLLSLDPALPFTVQELCGYLKTDVNFIRKIYYNRDNSCIILFKPSFKSCDKLNTSDMLVTWYKNRIFIRDVKKFTESIQTLKPTPINQANDLTSSSFKAEKPFSTVPSAKGNKVENLKPTPKESSWISHVFG
jgi:hypothetical protein